MQQYNYSSFKCSQCEKEILPIFDIYVEFDQHFYHKECFKCNSCDSEFKFDKTLSIPILDKFGKLYCTNDFIKTLNCGICTQNFGLDSQISKLFGKIEENEKQILVHTECIKCDLCKENLQVASEYTLVENRDDCVLSINCKNCVLNQSKESRQKVKCIKSVNHRLSSRQKELLASKIISDNIDVEKIMLSHESFEIFLETLSVFIKCSKKSLANYLNKHLNKNKQVKNRQDKENDSIKCMLDDLKKMDKIIAPPNQCPFTAQIRSKPSLTNITASVCN